MNKAQDHFAHLLNVQFLESTFEKAQCQMQLKPEHQNALGTTHGAVIFSLADITFATACNAGDGQFIGIQTEIRYMNQVKGDVIIATAQLISASRKVAHYQVEVTDQQQSKIALFTATAYRLA